MSNETAHLIGSTGNDLDRLEAARHNIQALVENGRISQREATRRMMAYAFSVGFDRGTKEQYERDE